MGNPFRLAFFFNFLLAFVATSSEPMERVNLGDHLFTTKGKEIRSLERGESSRNNINKGKRSKNKRKRDVNPVEIYSPSQGQVSQLNVTQKAQNHAENDLGFLFQNSRSMAKMDHGKTQQICDLSLSLPPFTDLTLNNQPITKLQDDGCYSSHKLLLFQKKLTSSDVGRLGRLVIPRKSDLDHFPPITSNNNLLGNIDKRCNRVASIELTFFDNELKNSYNFRYCYWKSSNSFVFAKGWRYFVHEKGLKMDDIVRVWVRFEYTCNISISNEPRKIFLIDVIDNNAAEDKDDEEIHEVPENNEDEKEQEPDTEINGVEDEGIENI